MKNRKAQDVAEAIKALADANGGTLTPEMVVRAAESVDSPLHDQFQWDDAKAGAAYRLDQARTLIRSVRVEFTINDMTVSAPYMVRDPDQDARKQGYTSIPRLKTDADAARAAIVMEFQRAGAALARARALAAVLDVQQEVDDAILRVDMAAAKAQGAQA